MAKKMDELKASELAAHLLGIEKDADDLNEQVEQKMRDKYQREFQCFRVLAADLLPLCDVGQSPITQNLFWLAVTA